MTCITDDASDTENREREAVIADRQARSALEATLAAAREAARGDGPAICVDCENPIPTPRRQAVPGCLRCALCERQHFNRNSARR